MFVSESAGLALLTVRLGRKVPGTGAASASVAAFNTAGTHSFVVSQRFESRDYRIGGARCDASTEPPGGEGETISEIVSVTSGCAKLTVSVAGSGPLPNATSGAGTGGVGGGGASGTPATEPDRPERRRRGRIPSCARHRDTDRCGRRWRATEGSSAVNGGNAGSPGLTVRPRSEGQSGTQTRAYGRRDGGVNATAGSPAPSLREDGRQRDHDRTVAGGARGWRRVLRRRRRRRQARLHQHWWWRGGPSYTSPGATSISGSTPTTAAPEVVISYSAQPCPGGDHRSC